MKYETQRAPGTELSGERSVSEALQHYVGQGQLPFAITRGAEHNLVYANGAFRRVAALTDSSALGAPIANGFSESTRTSFIAILDEGFLGATDQLDVPLSASVAGDPDWKCSIWPVIGLDGRPEGLGVELREAAVGDSDLDLQRNVAEQMLLAALRERDLADNAETARRRAAFLAEAGRLLTESVDQASTLVALTKLALPTLCDWCIVDILEEDQAIRRLGIYHSDREKQILAHRLEERWAPGPDDPFGAAAMLRGARTIAITEGIEATLAATAHGAENLDVLSQMGVGCLLSVPLVVRGKLLGAITFICNKCIQSYSTEEVQLAEDLASRAALALDNARNFDLALLLRKSAESANRAKTEFLGAMSHELRTPLNAIGGYIDLLDMGLRGPVTAEQRADFARVKSSQQHLALLITEILNFARAGAGGVAYSDIDIKVDEVMRHAVELIEPLFAQKEIVFDGISGDASIVARGDPERVTQILVNLLSNAIKFTAAGGRIGARFGATTDTVMMHISDTGIGIEADKLETIFEPFIQLKEGLADRAGGVGLGLAISRDLARAMNGDLTVTSKWHKGSRFTLSLPRATVQ